MTNVVYFIVLPHKNRKTILLFYKIADLFLFHFLSEFVAGGTFIIKPKKVIYEMEDERL